MLFVVTLAMATDRRLFVFTLFGKKCSQHETTSRRFRRRTGEAIEGFRLSNHEASRQSLADEVIIRVFEK